VVSWSLSVDSGQLAVVSWQLSVVRWEDPLRGRWVTGRLVMHQADRAAVLVVRVVADRDQLAAVERGIAGDGDELAVFVVVERDQLVGHCATALARLSQGDQAVLVIVFVQVHEVGHAVHGRRARHGAVVQSLAVVGCQHRHWPSRIRNDLRGHAIRSVVNVKVRGKIVDHRRQVAGLVVGPGDCVLPIDVQIGVGNCIIPNLLVKALGLVPDVSTPGRCSRPCGPHSLDRCSRTCR
jgi:hypothetical protein